MLISLKFPIHPHQLFLLCLSWWHNYFHASLGALVFLVLLGSEIWAISCLSFYSFIEISVAPGLIYWMKKYKIPWNLFTLLLLLLERLDETQLKRPSSFSCLRRESLWTNIIMLLTYGEGWVYSFQYILLWHLQWHCILLCWF